MFLEESWKGQQAVDQDFESVRGLLSAPFDDVHSSLRLARCLSFPACNVSVKTSNWITENFKCPSPMVSKPKTPSVADFLSYFIIDGYAKKLGTCFVPVNVHLNQYSDRI